MLDNPEVISDIVKRLRQLNSKPPPKYPDYWNRHVPIWQAKHPDKVREYRRASDARRRALRLGCEGFHTAQEWLDKKGQYGNRCAYCHRKLRRLTKDHIAPLSKGGTDYIYNIVPACRRCNISKSNKDVLAWEKFSGLQLSM